MNIWVNIVLGLACRPLATIAGTRAQKREGRLLRLGLNTDDLDDEEDEWEDL